MSLIFALAADLHRQMRTEYQAALEAEFNRADNDCNGYLLNRLGKAKGLTALDLFTGSETRAYTYASPELVQWWTTNGRLTQAAYEARFLAERGEELALPANNY